MSKIVVHIESGLGNQMLSYCEYLALKQNHPSDDLYLETLVFDIPECNDVICQWNGYELSRIFGIETSNIKELYSEDEWNSIIKEVRETKFWVKNWNYPVYITNVLNRHGFNLINIRGDFEKKWDRNAYQKLKYSARQFILYNTSLGALLKRKITFSNEKHANKACNLSNLFYEGNDDIFTGQWLSFKFNGNHIERIHDDILKTFVFPPFTDERNVKTAEMLGTTNSVFIHARRGDMLSANGWCYKYGFFKRAVNHIKRNVENPIFVFFTNTGSIEWCKEHAESIFGLSKNDNVLFVDWNVGDQSFRDMQLMTHCKHGIITNSTFGWWGAYLIKNPNKITISPLSEINTTYHC